jgi:plasmid maintenance system antidote protein VapI
MRTGKPISPITDVLRRTVVESGISYKALSRETGVARASIQRFVDGRQSIRLDMADRLAAYFRLSLNSDPESVRRKSDS